MAERRIRRGTAAVALAGAALLVTGCASSGASAAFQGTRIGTPLPAPATALEDTRGTPFSFTRDTDAALTLVFFGYTNCPDVCSQELADITSALTRIDEKQRDQVQVVFVTTDPERDTPAALTRYLGAFDSSYTGLTGSVASLETVSRAFGVYAARATDPDGQGDPEHPGEDGGGEYLVSHTDNTFAVVDDQVVATWMKEITSKQLAEDVVTLLKEKA